MADDSIRGSLFGPHEPVGQVGGLPADADGRVRAVGVLAGVPAPVVDAVDDDVGDIAVGSDASAGGEDGDQSRGLHFDGYFARKVDGFYT